MACHGKYPILKAEIIPNFIQKKIQFIQHVIYSQKQYKHSLLFLFIFELYANVIRDFVLKNLTNCKTTV